MYNRLLFIEEVAPLLYNNGTGKKKSYRAAKVQCKCGKIFVTKLHSVNSGLISTCGCENWDRFKKSATKHGLCTHRLFYKWRSMIRRCHKGDDAMSRYYYHRGIRVCDEWRNDFKAFYDYVTSLPGYRESGRGYEMQLDRINNDGNYEPGNLRWVNARTQRLNQRPRKNNSGYTGVSQSSAHRWEAYITVRFHAITIGYFNSVIEAIEARDRYIIYHCLWEYKLQSEKYKDFYPEE